MTFETNKDLLDTMRRMNQQGQSPSAILGMLVERPEIPSRIVAIIYFKEAFALRLAVAMQVGAWDFFEEGGWDAAKVDEELTPFLLEKR